VSLSLICAPPLQLITKIPAGKSVSTSDKFSCNDGFSCQLRKIKVPMASLDEGTDTKRVEEDRSIAIEAAVVSQHSRPVCSVVVGFIRLLGVLAVAGANDEDSQGDEPPGAGGGGHRTAAFLQTESQGVWRCCVGSPSPSPSRVVLYSVAVCVCTCNLCVAATRRLSSRRCGVWLSVQVIKRRIEHLIEREYLERDTADVNLYRYLA
jgi:hypothetical protein